MILETTIKVRYAETDQMGVVYHANYLIWFEVARTEFLESLGYPYKKLEAQGVLSPVLKAEIEYGAPLRYGDTVKVYTRIVETSSVKSIYAYEIYKNGQTPGSDQPSCTGRTTHCLVRKTDFRPVSMKKVTPALLEAYLSIVEPQE